MIQTRSVTGGSARRSLDGCGHRRLEPSSRHLGRLMGAPGRTRDRCHQRSQYPTISPITPKHELRRLTSGDAEMIHIDAPRPTTEMSIRKKCVERRGDHSRAEGGVALEAMDEHPPGVAQVREPRGPGGVLVGFVLVSEGRNRGA